MSEEYIASCQWMRLRSGVNIAANSRQGANKHTPFFLTPVFFKRSASFSLISLSDGIDCSSTSSMPNVVPSISFASGSTLLNVRELDPRTAEAPSILEERRRLHLYPVLTFLCDLIPPQRRPSLLVKHSQSHEFASLSIELLHRATTEGLGLRMDKRACDTARKTHPGCLIIVSIAIIRRVNRDVLLLLIVVVVVLNACAS